MTIYNAKEALPPGTWKIWVLFPTSTPFIMVAWIPQKHARVVPLKVDKTLFLFSFISSHCSSPSLSSLMACRLWTMSSAVGNLEFP